MIMFVYSMLSALDLQTSECVTDSYTLFNAKKGGGGGAAVQFLRFICCLFDQQTHNDDG